jgi:hypothetical protein
LGRLAKRVFACGDYATGENPDLEFLIIDSTIMRHTNMLPTPEGEK